MRKYYYKYELLNNSGEWVDFTNQVVGTTNINLGNIEEIGSEDFGIDSLKKFANFTVSRDKNKRLTASPLLGSNQFMIGRRVRIKVRTAQSQNYDNRIITGSGANYIYVPNIIDYERVVLSTIDNGGAFLSPSEADISITSVAPYNLGIYIYFSRPLYTYEKASLLVVYTASDLDTDRVEIEGTGASDYFVDNISPDTVKILGHWCYYWLPGHYYFTHLYFSDTYGVSYHWYPREGDPNYPFEIVNAVTEGNGLRFYLNKPLPLKYRLVIGLFYNEKEDRILFDGKIRSFQGTGYHTVSYEAQDFSYDLGTMALNMTYEKGQTFESVIEQILADNNKYTFTFLYDSQNTMTLTEDYELENVTVWDAIQKLALMKGWSLYFQYNRQRDEQCLVFEDSMKASYVTYTLLRKDLVGDFTYKGDLSRVRNVVDVIFKDSENNDMTTTVSVSDANSINLYRENRLTLGTDVTEKVITTHATATNLANQALYDLKDPVIYYSLGATLLPKLKLNDELWYQHENIQEKALQIRVYSIQHDISVDDSGTMTGTTTITGGGKVQYKLNEWLYNDAKVKENNEIIIV